METPHCLTVDVMMMMIDDDKEAAARDEMMTILYMDFIIILLEGMTSHGTLYLLYYNVVVLKYLPIQWG